MHMKLVFQCTSECNLFFHCLKWVCCDLRRSLHREQQLCSPGTTLTFTFTANSYTKHPHKPRGNLKYINGIPKRISPRTNLDPSIYFSPIPMLQTCIFFVVLRRGTKSALWLTAPTPHEPWEDVLHLTSSTSEMRRDFSLLLSICRLHA